MFEVNPQPRQRRPLPATTRCCSRLVKNIVTTTRIHLRVARPPGWETDQHPAASTSMQQHLHQRGSPSRMRNAHLAVCLRPRQPPWPSCLNGQLLPLSGSKFPRAERLSLGPTNRTVAPRVPTGMPSDAVRLEISVRCRRQPATAKRCWQCSSRRADQQGRAGAPDRRQPYESGIYLLPLNNRATPRAMDESEDHGEAHDPKAWSEHLRRS